MEKCSTWNDTWINACQHCEAKLIQRGDGYRDDDSYDRKNEYHRISSRDRGYPQDDATIASNEALAHTAITPTELDEFGRVKSVQPKKVRWPPCFETNGSAFVLDTRSGMFYETISDFFYDPKSKLYYGNKQSAYFQYDPVKRSFINLSENKQDTAECEGNIVVDNLGPSSTKQAPEIKKTSITINLKTKSLAPTKPGKKPKKEDGSAKDKSNIVISEPVTVPKQHAMNIEKWSERQVEIRQQVYEGKSKVGDDDRVQPVATAKGEPICLLCRRRFPNLDKLRHHEEVSNLHKENLAKQAALATVEKGEQSIIAKNAIMPNVTTTATYLDRAEQRRQLHQSEKMIVNTGLTLNSDVQSVVSADTYHSRTSIEVEAKNITSSTLDESNIGHQMLQKLGWKSGNVLGKKTDCGNPAADSVRQSESATTTSRMEQDWDRIEAVSKLAQRGTTMNLGKKGIGH